VKLSKEGDTKMKSMKSLIQHFAPTLASALGGPFAGVATKFITDNLINENSSDGRSSDEVVEELLNDSKNLQKIKDLDNDFRLEMERLNVDVFSLENEDRKDARSLAKTDNKPQIVISILFLTAYFLMLVAIFVVEASDTINMKEGANSLMGELQILFGVLTAGVGQILSFWFGGALKKNDVNSN
jgi:hypothetical protein